MNTSMEKSKGCCESCRENPPSGDNYCTAKGCKCYTPKVEKSECEGLNCKEHYGEEHFPQPEIEKNILTDITENRLKELEKNGAKIERILVPQPEVKDCEGVHHGNCGAHNCCLNFSPEVKGWKESLYDKYSNKGDERFGTVKSENTILQNILDEFSSILAAQAKGWEGKKEKLDFIIKDIISYAPDGEINTLCHQALQILTEDHE